MQNLFGFLNTLNRPQKMGVQLAADTALIIVSFGAAMILQFEDADLAGRLENWGALSAGLIATVIAFYTLGLYRALVRYITGTILLAIAKGVLVGAIMLHLAGVALSANLPGSVTIIFAVFAFLSVGGLRFFARALLRKLNHSTKQPVIVYGAGDAGMQVLNALFHGHDYAPVALVDDDPSLQNLTVGGLRVVAPRHIPQLVSETGARVVLLAVPSMGRARRRTVVGKLSKLHLEIKSVPGLLEIMEGKETISQLHTVRAEDLLGRDPVAPNYKLMGKTITNRVVMVTGAGGSIGSELCRQILEQRPRKLMLFEASEFALYAIESELTATANRLKCNTQIVPVLGSVQHQRRLEAVIQSCAVETLYHAAAYKHVPLVEDNTVEAIRNNVFGTLAIAQAAKKLGVANFILISTDKAVRPTNIMGATKRLAELICQAYAHETTATVFSMVRFGNVLGSSGSVIPKFRAQIESGGPVTVTHQDITRYFMTTIEAAQLVIQAGALSKGGDVFVLEMGEPVKIMDLAMSMVKLSGLSPYLVDHREQVFPDKGDIPICVTGLRKGEKLFEELLIGNNPRPTQHPRILTASEAALPMSELDVALNRLLRACQNHDLSAISTILRKLPISYATHDCAPANRPNVTADEPTRDVLV